MIEVEHLTKRYGGHTAVDDLTFTIGDGEIYGFLGPNGAGKSTTMNIITGCLAATSGTVRVDGHDIFEEPVEAKRLLGYLPEQPPVYPDMTPQEYLEFVAKAKGLKGGARKEQIDRVLALTGTAEVAGRLIKNLSKGYRQRVGIAQALLGDPKIIILDEPTVGLDPAQIIEIRDLIRSLGKEHTVILSSHILSEVQAVCGSILILSHGRLVACDTPDNLEKLFAGEAVVTLRAKAAGEAALALAQKAADTAACSLTAEAQGIATLAVTAQSGDADALGEQLFFAFAEAGVPILSMTGTRASLEDVFLELTQSEAAAAPETPRQAQDAAETPETPSAAPKIEPPAQDAEPGKEESSGESHV